ncbi:hypothetical protein [Fusibacter tunisiensis]|uniref:Uncharacterized protein n=1 Tax=Fusibacter tunisiensis TaxID=1008308 RepID=A0ABS2MMQ6_9FIRM|nr:hypothetical protein [Fusibacter tunisiensis]MBM7560683.1 hypothetical protein [Fusibacter tunisiensis]
MKNSLIILGIILILFLTTYYMESTTATIDIYSADANTLERLTVDKLTVHANASIEDRLLIITQGLSEKVFKLPMAFIEIKQIFNQDIAYINLLESPDKDKTHAWNIGYFQGSTGSAVTSIALVDSYLQPDYEGAWIDGVKFLYEGETIQFDHVYGLQQTQYRHKVYTLAEIDENDKLLENISLKSKSISDNKREITYELRGEFPANVMVQHYAANDSFNLLILESPIRALNIKVDFAENFMPYTETFDWKIPISNPDTFLEKLKNYDLTLYEKFINEDPVYLSVLLADFNSWLNAESEYLNSVRFIDIITD